MIKLIKYIHGQLFPSASLIWKKNQKDFISDENQNLIKLDPTQITQDPRIDID